MSTLRHVVVLGGGPAGLATAHELTAGGTRVTVLEREGHVGGLARTIHHKGYKFDLGGHRWFTKNEDLNDWFRRLMDGHLVMVDRISRIYHEGKYYNYPISIGDLVKNVSPLTIAQIGASFAWASLRQAAGGRPVVTMQQAYTAQFGTKLYEMFFRRYSEKVWGAPCTELSADWVSQRSRGLSVATLAREALLGSRKDVVSLVEQFMYPRDGYMRISERMAEDITAAGNEVLLGARVTGVAYRGPADFEVAYIRDGETSTIQADAVVSTIPLGVLARILSPACGPEVEAAARGLVFRDLITANVMLRRRRVSPDTWLYIQDSDILFGRMHEPKNWSPAMVPDDEHTSLVLECFCSRGDHIWSMTDEEIGRRCVADLVNKLGFIEAAEVEDIQIVRTRDAYPVYDLDYTRKTQTIQRHLRRHGGLHTVGRGGTFRYNNADHSIEMGLLLGREMQGEEVDHMAVNTDRAYQEVKRAGEQGGHYRRRSVQVD